MEHTQLHLSKFPAELKRALEEWGKNQIPEQSLTQVVIKACNEWAERNIKMKNTKQAKIIELERQLEALKREEM